MLILFWVLLFEISDELRTGQGSYKVWLSLITHFLFLSHRFKVLPLKLDFTSIGPMFSLQCLGQNQNTK
jgi:hypothetical protein